MDNAVELWSDDQKQHNHQYRPTIYEDHIMDSNYDDIAILLWYTHQRPRPAPTLPVLRPAL